MLCCVWCVFLRFDTFLVLRVLCVCLVVCPCVSLRRWKRWTAIDFLMPWIFKTLASIIANLVLLPLLLRLTCSKLDQSSSFNLFQRI